MDLLAQWGLTFLQDSAISNSVSFQCLSCQKKFFIPMRFVQHLQQDHNYKQMHTLLCYHRLSLHHPLPCSFCGSSEHQAQCHALLNLAVFLTNGFGPDRGGGDRRCFQDLGPSAHFRAAASLRHERRSEQTQQEAQSRHQEEGSEITIDLLNDNITRAHEHSDQTGAETRGQSEHSLAGERISTAFEPGQGEHSTSAIAAEPNLAQERPQHLLSETRVGPDHDANPGCPTDNSPGREAGRSSVSGVHDSTPGAERCREIHALPSLELSTEVLAASREGRDSDVGGGAQCFQHTASDEGQQCNIEIPLPEESQGWHGPAASAMAVDRIPPQLSGTLARTGAIIASRHLAVDSSSFETTDARSAASGGPASEGSVSYGLIRVFLNPSGTACSANSVVCCLAWLMLLADGFKHELWRVGFELMRNVVYQTLVPIDLLRHAPFVWLLTGAWSIERFREEQQDATEFCDYLLNYTRPGFLSCSWDTRPSFAEGVQSVYLAHEKGPRFSPLKLPFCDIHADSCFLQHLINVWHDDQGLCRAATEVGFQLVISIDRHTDDTHVKCTQKIEFPQNQILFPCFCNSAGDVTMDLFEVCCLVYHLGFTPHTGHYRAALRCKGGWLLYDDGTVPDRVLTLPETVLRNCVLIWLVRPTPSNARTMMEEGDNFPTIYSAHNVTNHSRW